MRSRNDCLLKRRDAMCESAACAFPGINIAIEAESLKFPAAFSFSGKLTTTTTPFVSIARRRGWKKYCKAINTSPRLDRVASSLSLFNDSARDNMKRKSRGGEGESKTILITFLSC